MPKPKDPAGEAIARLGELFRRNGYLRMPNPDRRAAESRAYKKGYEVRLVANSADELAAIRQLLKTAGFPVANAFQHDRQWRQPLYGRAEVARFLKLIGWKPDGKSKARAPSAAK